ARAYCFLEAGGLARLGGSPPSRSTHLLPLAPSARSCPSGVFGTPPSSLASCPRGSLPCALEAAAFPQPIRLHDDAACAFERAADPLYCARIDTEAFRNDAHTWSPRNRQGLADSFFKCGSNWGAPQALPLDHRF